MREFEEYIKSGAVKKITPNPDLASALLKSSQKNLNFVSKLEINNENSELIVQDCYDIIRELIESRLSKEGYKSYSHEATISFLRKFKQFSLQEIDFIDRLRVLRNNIKYYGKESNSE